MRLIPKLIVYAISTAVVTVSLYLQSVPVAAMVYPYQPLPSSADRVIQPREYLYLHAGSDAKVLDRIIACESGWHSEARSKTSSATGLGQFLSGTWTSTRLRMGFDTDLELRKDPYESIDTLIFLWDNGQGAGHWRESLPCWG